MGFEINVALNGKHYFATAEQSLTCIKDAIQVYYQFRTLFLEKEGYQVTISENTSSSRELTINDLEGL